MSEGSGGKKRKDFQTYLAPVSVKLIINLLEHHFFPLGNQRPLLRGNTQKKSNTEDVAVAQLCKYCDYYVNACTRRDDMSKASEQTQQRASDKETGNPIACCCRVFFFIFFLFFFLSRCTPGPDGSLQVSGGGWRKSFLSLRSRRPLLWESVSRAPEPPAVSPEQQVDAAHTAAGHCQSVEN